MYHEYYINRNSKKHNLDNLYKKHLPLLYITLDQKYVITDKDNLISKNNIFELLMNIYYIYMMNSYKNYIHVLRHILKNFDDNKFDHIIKNILIKIFDIYYLERDIQLYNIDNAFKKCNMNMYNLLSK